MIMRSKYFAYNYSDPFNGVINYLRVNEVDKFNNFLTVEATSSEDTAWPRNTIDQTQLYWIAKPNEQPYIKFLLPYPVKVNGYLIQTSNNPPGECHPKTWRFEASLDGIKNKISKEYYDNGKLNNNLAYSYFELEKGVYQSFKIMPLTSYRDDLCPQRFDFNEFEVYGTILFPNESTCAKNSFKMKLLYIFIIIF